MMINKFLVLMFAAIPLAITAQIPNADFENWDSVTINNPAGYRIYGRTIKVNGYKSPFAVKIMKDEQLNQGPGAVIYGNPENGFTGGIPAVGRPDSAIGYFKYHIVPGDTAWFLVHLKKNGMFISQDIFKITGTDTSTFRRLAFKINYSDTGVADSMIVGVASTNPNDNLYGSFMIADSLHFVGGSGNIMIPNGNFEQWVSRGINTPPGWFTSNMQGMPGNALPVTKTTDRVFNNYACRIENIPLGNGQFQMGYIMAGRQGQNGPEPGFAVGKNDSVLYVNYKCFPKGGDTINIAIMMFRNDSMVGMGNFRQWNTVSTWTRADIPINYFNGRADSAVIFCAAFQGGDMARGNSVLYVDGLSLNKPQSGLSSHRILPAKVYPNPADNTVTIFSTVAVTNETEIMLYDLSGKTIKPEFSLLSDGHSIRLNTSLLHTGIWYFKIAGKGISQQGKIVISR